LNEEKKGTSELATHVLDMWGIQEKQSERLW